MFLQDPARALVANCDQLMRRKLLVVHSWRSMSEQALIFQKGRAINRETGRWEVSDASAVVTRARISGHNVITRSGAKASVCLDVIPLFADGQIDWDPGAEFWVALYKLAASAGFDAYGDSHGAYYPADKGHFEEPCWKLKLNGLGLLLPIDETNL